MTERALYFTALLQALEDAIYRKTRAEIKHSDEAEVTKRAYQKSKARLRAYIKTLTPEDLESL